MNNVPTFHGKDKRSAKGSDDRPGHADDCNSGYSKCGYGSQGVPVKKEYLQNKQQIFESYIETLGPLTEAKRAQLMKEMDNLYLSNCAEGRQRHGYRMNILEPQKETDLIKHTAIISPYTKVFEPHPTEKDSDGQPLLLKKKMLLPLKPRHFGFNE